MELPCIGCYLPFVLKNLKFQINISKTILCNILCKHQIKKGTDLRPIS